MDSRDRVSLEDIERLYESNLTNHGRDSRAVGWPTPSSQKLRFEVLSQAISSFNGPASVIDYGCGLGDHLLYLNSIGVDVTEYSGYDISAAMVAAAKQNLQNSRGAVQIYESATVHTPADFTFVSGTFNVKLQHSDEEWSNFIKQVLLQLFESTRKNLSFNLLSTYVDWKDPNLFYGNPAEWLEWCQRNLSKHVNLYHAYPLYEWTISVYRG